MALFHGPFQEIFMGVSFVHNRHIGPILRRKQIIGFQGLAGPIRIAGGQIGKGHNHFAGVKGDILPLQLLVAQLGQWGWSGDDLYKSAAADSQ